ncbi:MAG: hypothetical protein IRZ13_04005 [Acetobacteraceae bacterium]|nr:hypothetical protein [Acetobacteraceae bacterium]
MTLAGRPADGAATGSGRGAWAARPRLRAESWSLDGGFAWRGPSGRREDALSFGVSYARIGSGACGLDRDRTAFGEDMVLRTHETVVELNYIMAFF